MIVRLVALVLLAFAQAAPNPPMSGLPTVTTAKGNIQGDPVNIGFEGSKAAILAAFNTVGWLQADPLSPKNDARLAVDAVLRRPYPKAPVSNLYLFGRAEDFAVEQELGSVAKRNHARFWDTARADPGTDLELWIGDASQDNGIEVLRRHHVPVGTTHHINPDLDAERSLIVTLMQHAGLAVTVVYEPGIGATTTGKNGGGDRYYTDGKIAVIVLKG